MKQKRKKMKQKRNSWRIRDIVIGFLGWALLDNMYLLLGTSLGFFLSFAQAMGFFLPLVLPLLIVSLILFLKKQTWIGIGIAIALVVNFGIWAILYGLHLGQWYFYFLCPFPVGTRLII